MQFFPSRILTESDIVRLYEWAERSPSAVLKCTCRQVRRMKALSSAAHAIGGKLRTCPRDLVASALLATSSKPTETALARLKAEKCSSITNNLASLPKSVAWSLQ